MQTDSFDVRSFKLGVRPEQPVPILIAALREGMLKLAGREGDGAIINWLGADDVAKVAPIVQGAGDGSAKEVVARSEEHTSELQSLMRISYAVFCLNKKT